MEHVNKFENPQSKLARETIILDCSSYSGTRIWRDNIMKKGPQKAFQSISDKQSCNESFHQVKGNKAKSIIWNV